MTLTYFIKTFVDLSDEFEECWSDLVWFWSCLSLNPSRSWSCLGLDTRAGYHSKFFDIDTDTLSSIPVPERYFFRYQFYEISFNKITLSQKTLFFNFFQLVEIYTDSKTHLLSHCTKELNISDTINQCK